MQKIIDQLIPDKDLKAIISALYRYQLATICRKMGLRLAMRGFENFTYQSVATGLSGIVLFTYIFTLHWAVALFLLLYIPVSFIPSNWFANRVQDLSKRIIKNNAKMNQIINDTFKGIKFIKAMVLEK